MVEEDIGESKRAFELTTQFMRLIYILGAIPETDNQSFMFSFMICLY